MRDIERVLAAFLLAGAVAGVVVMPRLAGPQVGVVPLVGALHAPATTVVDAAPLPTPKPQTKPVVGVAVHAASVEVVTPHVRVAPHHQQPIQRAPHVPAVAPDVVQAPAPVASPSPQPAPPGAPAPASASIASPTVAPTPTTLPGIGLGLGKGHGKDKGADGTVTIQLPQVDVQVQVPPADHGNGNANGKGHGHDKGA